MEKIPNVEQQRKPPLESDKEHLKKIVSIWQELKTVVKAHNISKEVLLKDLSCQWAMATPLRYIGEQVNRLSTDIKDRYKEIDWDMILNLRNQLLHDYENLNWNTVTDIVFGEMEEFVNQVEQILSEF